MGQSRRAANRNTAPASITATRIPPRSAGKRNNGAREAVILLSGFEPFAGERRNPSREVARALDGELIAGLRVRALELPVTYAKAARLMSIAIARVQPAAVLGLGQAGGRTVITLERIAINLLDGPHGPKLESSQKLRYALKESSSYLNNLASKLELGRGRKSMSRLGIRALRWPFTSKEVDRIISGLKQSKENVALAMQIDQT